MDKPMSTSRADSEKALGQVLVANGTVSHEQLDLALMLREAQPDRHLSEILFQIGIPQEKINRALYYSNRRKTIGEILIDQGMITAEQLENALSKQRYIKSHWELTKTLGELLIEMGCINSRSLLVALSKHFNMPILSMKNYMPNPDFQKAIGKKYARKHKVIVLDNGPKTIKLVLAEPSVHIVEELQKAIPPGKAIEFYLARYDEIDECLGMMPEAE